MLATGMTERRMLWGLIALSVAARLGSALLQGNQIEALPGITDQISYHELAQRVLAGKGFSFATGWWPATPAGEPTAHWSYLYVLFLSGVYGLFGANPLAARLLQAMLVGVLHPWLAYRVANRVFGQPAVGLVSAAITAAYAYFIYYGAALVTEPFYLVAVLWVADVATNLLVREAKPWRPWLMLGLAFGLGVLLRQLLLVIMPVVLLWLIWRLARTKASGLTWRQGAQRATVSLGVVGLFILPWTIRNYAAFDQFILLNTNAGFAFFWGNHPIHGREFIPILPGDGSQYGTLIPDDVRGLNEAAMDRELLKRGVGFVIVDPARFFALSASRTREYFKFWWDPASGRLSNYARVFSFGVCLPFLVVGIALALRGPAPEGVLFLLGLAGLYTLIHLLTWTLVRYRLPVDALMTPFMAVGMLTCWRAVLAAFHAPQPVPQTEGR